MNLKVFNKGFSGVLLVIFQFWTISTFAQIGDITINNEVLPASTAKCFEGAYYRKAVSSTDYWLGIGGKVILPQIEFDQNRRNPKKLGSYLDNASIYLGGNSDGQETDIGLTWEVIKEEDGNVSKERKAFRPFLRRTAYKNSQESNYKNAPATKEFYWYPGDTVTISIEIVEPKLIKFVLSNTVKKYEELFEVAGYNKNTIANFKRVNAIDQVSNEGKPVQQTNTKLIGAKWLAVYLFRVIDGEIIKIPMTQKRFTDMQCPSKENFVINSTANSAEEINIYGKK